MHTATYPGIKIRTKLFAAALAVAGSVLMVGGNLVVAATYAANAGIAPSTLLARGGMPRQVAIIKCSNNAS